LNKTISVLICTYSRNELLYQALESLFHGTVEKPEQVIIVNGGDEQADLTVRKFLPANGIEVKLIKTVNINLATSRNIGLPHCQGDIIAMTDDDAQVFPDWVSQMKSIHNEHPEAGAIGGAVIGKNTQSLVGKTADVITFPSWAESRYVRTLPGVNISYKRKVVEQIGFQDETLFRGEDVDYNYRVIKAGYQVYFDPSIKVYHFHRPSLKGFLYQHYMYGRAYYLVRHKWHNMYCIYPHQLKKFKDWGKTFNFLIGPFYQPFIDAKKLTSRKDRVLALPLLFTAGAIWRYGMVMEKLKQNHPKS
jgi:GT2 family glycosyltransferase